MSGALEEDDIARMKEVFSRWPKRAELVYFAMHRHGYGDSDGGFGVIYANDLDEHDLQVEKQFIPAKMVEIYGFWGTPEGYDFLVSETDYLKVLAEYLREIGMTCEADDITALIEPTDE